MPDSRGTSAAALAATVGFDQLQTILGAEVARYVSQGYTAESVIGTTATLTKNKRIGWFWNAILTVFTGGLWLVVVIYRVINRKRYTIVVTVDQDGKVIPTNRAGARTSK